MIPLEQESRFRRGGLAFALAALALAFSVVAPGSFAGSGQASPRIVGGTEAAPDAWLSQAALIASSQANAELGQFCGGTLIDRDWVLTAAHCVTRDDGTQVSASAIDVAVGIETLSEIGPSDRIDVSSIIVNPDWDREASSGDFALLRLATPSGQPTMPLIQPAGEPETAGGRPAEIAGWGCFAPAVGECTPGGDPDRLLQARISFVSDSVCGSPSAWGSQFDPATMICAGSISTGTPTACFGDSGGPLTANVGGQRVLAGVTSFATQRCSTPGVPTVFARVATARSWIEKTVGRVAAVSGIALKPNKTKVKAGEKVVLRVRVTNSGDAATTALVRFKSGNRAKATVPGSLALEVGAKSSATGKVTVRTKRGRSGKVTVKATLGSQTAKSTVTLKG
ncbi:MAG: trypsin-like serine protease [Solirubrobacterales bacterium]